MIELRPIEPGAARDLLASVELPIDDLDDPSITLIGAFDDKLVGVIGMQACGPVALLRSLAVARDHRDRGVARALCEAVYALAGERPLWLLTTTARDYFARRGFEVIERDEVPAAIRTTAQFSNLCPASAHVMRRG